MTTARFVQLCSKDVHVESLCTDSDLSIHVLNMDRRWNTETCPCVLSEGPWMQGTLWRRTYVRIHFLKRSLNPDGRRPGHVQTEEDPPPAQARLRGRCVTLPSWDGQKSSYSDPCEGGAAAGGLDEKRNPSMQVTGAGLPSGVKPPLISRHHFLLLKRVTVTQVHVYFMTRNEPK